MALFFPLEKNNAKFTFNIELFNFFFFSPLIQKLACQSYIGGYFESNLNNIN